MEDALYTVLGLIAFYTWVHFTVLGFIKTWKQRSGYEKAVSIAAVTLFFLFIVGSI